MKGKTALKSVPKPEAPPDTLEEYLAKRMLPDIARKNADLIHLAGEFADPILVERWELQQVFDLLYSIELIVEPFKHKDNEEGNIYYMLRPHMNEFSDLFSTESDRLRLYKGDSKKRGVE